MARNKTGSPDGEAVKPGAETFAPETTPEATPETAAEAAPAVTPDAPPPDVPPEEPMLNDPAAPVPPANEPNLAGPETTFRSTAEPEIAPEAEIMHEAEIAAAAAEGAPLEGASWTKPDGARFVDEPEDIALVAEVDAAIARGGPPPTDPEDAWDETREESPAATIPRDDARPEPVVTHEERRVEAESGSSFAARALAALLFLLIGGGLALWLGPKIAPSMPAPVARWLAPGSDSADARIAALESRLETEVDAVRAQVADLGGAELDARIGAAVDAAGGKIEGEFAELRTQLGEVDGATTRQRLDRADAAIQGQVAELQGLKDQITGGAAAGSGAAAAGIDVYRSEIEGLRAEMGSLTDRVAGLGARVDEVGAEARRQIDTAQATVDTIQAEATTAISAAALRADFAQVQAAMAAGLPFAEPLDRLAADPRLQIPEALNAAAASGIESLAELRDGFADSAHGAIRASILASSGDGVIARSRAFLEAQVATRSLTPQEGQGTDAVLSRMEEKLRQDDLNGVLTEAGQLPSEAAQAMSGWLAALKLRADAEAGLSALNAELPATN